jgi:diguanylate cyclase (GGDEF)-like protein
MARVDAKRAHTQHLFSRLLRGFIVPLVPTVALGVVLASQVRHVAATRAMDDAKGSAELISRLGIQSRLSPTSLRDGLSPTSYAALDSAVRSDLLGTRVVRLKVWNAADRVVYSDLRELVGRTFPPNDGLRGALHGQVHAEVTSAQEAENIGEHGHGRLLEVYVPLTFQHGRVDGAFELYLPYQPIANAIRHDTNRLYLLILIGVAMLYLALLRIARDDFKLRRHATRSEYLAHHDPLTGLANRAMFRERVNKRLADHGPCAVLFVDLDDFKTVNDTLGHAAGDKLLVEVANRLRNCVRADDLVARLGGDEFAVLVDTAATAQRLADRIGGALTEPVRLDDQLVSAPASVGIAVATGDVDTETLLRSADIAMYSSKGSYQVFQPEMLTTLLHRREVESGLRTAIDNEELRLHYQPIHDLRTGAVTGVEALLRWQHPTLGLLAPDRFLELAESTGLIVPIGRWVLREACRQAARWNDRGFALDLHVNASELELHPDDFVDSVLAILAETRLSPTQLVLEVTESQATTQNAAHVATLESLRVHGVRVALDDFGTGQSSLNRLGEFPVDVLKIDRSFVAGVGRGQAATSLTKAIVALAHALSIAVVAEGVEDDLQRSELQLLGCYAGQGYGLTRPAGAEETTALLSSRPDTASSRQRAYPADVHSAREALRIDPEPA